MVCFEIGPEKWNNKAYPSLKPVGGCLVYIILKNMYFIMQIPDKQRSCNWCCQDFVGEIERTARNFLFDLHSGSLRMLLLITLMLWVSNTVLIRLDLMWNVPVSFIY